MDKESYSEHFSQQYSPLSKILFRQVQSTPDPDIFPLVLFALVPVMVAFSFMVFLVYRSRREHLLKQRESELKLQKAEVELKALKAQINPHFIFNCLNSIHHYMYSHPVGEAGNYLVKFSQQIRYVLESSEQKWVPLFEEIEANRIYLELEQLRLNQSFTFAMDCSEGLDPAEVYIPPMLIQPFLENSVWHGVSGGGHVEVRFSVLDDDHILCAIQDQAYVDASRTDFDLTKRVKKTSMGMHLMEERFAILNEVHGKTSGFSIKDREDGVVGKQVHLRIPYDN